MIHPKALEDCAIAQSAVCATSAALLLRGPGAQAEGRTILAAPKLVTRCISAMREKGGPSAGPSERYADVSPDPLEMQHVAKALAPTLNDEKFDKSWTPLRQLDKTCVTE
ncbi:hypothetical protein NDU88_003935 [Pleurodeles waltl]|uniref:Uncharacterized protein n=1 Tax=Pleurodeles waltl TaxID=8319 RepID=A0AAV7W6E7_PLEWA|nr:hypothetical protein NDU88_003935 [Pleurodeles waltl]